VDNDTWDATSEQLKTTNLMSNLFNWSIATLMNRNVRIIESEVDPIYRVWYFRFISIFFILFSITGFLILSESGQVYIHSLFLFLSCPNGI